MKKLLVLLGFVFIVGCKQSNVPKSYDNDGGSYKILTIEGYTYYQGKSGYGVFMAPTPETIKRCIKEAREE